jgi:hypothetical protein
MASNPHYVADLQAKLTELAAVEAEFKAAETKKKEIRSQIEKWLGINNIDHYEVSDNNGQIWKIDLGSQSRTKIADWNILRQVLGQENSHLIVESTSDVFRVQQIQSFSEAWLKEQAI